jgi:O-antigen/teichoic acid export membrane protein
LVAQKAARGGLFLFVGYAASTVILAVGIIIVARLLGPSSYGLYVLATVVPLLVVSLSDVGMNFAVVRLPARLRAEGKHTGAARLVRLGVFLKLAISAVAFVACYLASPLIAVTVLNRPELAPFLRIASLMIVFQALVEATINSFIGHDLMQYSAGVQIMQAVLKGTLGPAFVLVGFGIAGALSGYVLSLAAAGLVGAAILFTRHARSPDQGEDSVSAGLRSLLGYGLPLYLASTLGMFLIQYQNIVLAHFSSNVEIGNFSATWNFTSFMMILIYPVTTAIFPMFSKMDPKNQRSDLARGFVLAVKYTSLLMTPASVAVMVFSRDFIYLTYGGSFTFAPQYLVLLAALYLLTAISYIVIGSFLNGVADTRTVIKMSILTLAVYLPVAPVLAQLWGPFGLLIAYILSNATSTIYGIRQTSGKFGARPDLKAGGRILLAAFVAAVPTVAFVRLDGAGVGVVNLIVGGLLYLFVYLTLTPVVGAVDRQDILNLKSLLGKTLIVGALLNPVFDYETRLLSKMKRD